MAEGGTLTPQDVPKAQAPGSVTVPDGEFRVFVKRVTLSGSERLTISGTGRVVIL